MNRFLSPLTTILLLFVLFVQCTPDDTPSKTGPRTPPFSGTIFIDPDIVLPSDPTTFVSLTYEGQEERVMFDRRPSDWITVSPYLFDTTFDDGLSIEIQVNPEFESSGNAQTEAEKYAPIIGQLSTSLRADVETVWIHKGVNPFGGGNNNLLIHTGQADLYVADGILEETLIHEASHSSLDADYATSSGWELAQEKDNVFISTYARDNPDREDIAETFLTYFAVKFRAERISKELFDTINETIPNRIEFLEKQNLNMYPVE